MGSTESRSDFSSIYSKILIDITIIFIHLFVFVFISVLTKKGLQSELESANKEGDCVRQRLRYQNEQLERVKEKHDLEVHDDTKKYGECSGKNLFIMQVAFDNLNFLDLIFVSWIYFLQKKLKKAKNFKKPL